jgi:hypothetical protein
MIQNLINEIQKEEEEILKDCPKLKGGKLIKLLIEKEMP